MSYTAIERETGIGRRRVKNLVEKPAKSKVKTQPTNRELMKSISVLRKMEARLLPKNCFNVYQRHDWFIG